MRSSKIKLMTGAAFLALVFAFLIFAFLNVPPVFAEEATSSSESATETSPIEDEFARKQAELARQQAERLELENQLALLENEIEENQKTIENYQKQGKTLKNEISLLNAKIEKLNLQIKAVNLTLAKLNQEINETQRNINRTENKIDLHRDAISKSIRALYEADRTGLAMILLANTKLSDFFSNLNNISLVQQNLRVALSEIVRLRQELLEQKEELSTKKDDAENLKAIQQAQKKNVETTKVQKNNLLKVTQGKESEYQKLLKEKQATAAQIRSRIFQLLGGGELTFEKAYDYAKLAAGATGIRAAFILAILNHESLLGKNVGRCSYQKAMNPKDIPIFLGILGKLNIDPNSTVAQVSCPNSDGIYGGAMGPAQFIPSTWKLYESNISAATGNNPPNPWNNSDAFVATALYLKDAMAECKSIYNTQSGQERCAAAKYYAGRRWRSYLWTYGDRVATKANDFQKDIDILNSSSSSNTKGSES